MKINFENWQSIAFKVFCFALVVSNVVIIYEALPIEVAFLSLAIVALAAVPLQKTLSLILRVSLILGSLYLLKSLFIPFLDTECFIALISLLSAIKLMELNSEGDYFHLLLILVLAEGANLLLSPTFFMLLFSMSKIILFIIFLMKLNGVYFSQIHIGRLLLYTLPALPMTIALFLVLPKRTFLFPTLNKDLFAGSQFVESSMDFLQLTPLSLTNRTLFTVFDPHEIQREGYWRQATLLLNRGMQWKDGSYNLIVDDPSLTRKESQLYVSNTIKSSSPYIKPITYNVPSTISGLNNLTVHTDGTFSLQGQTIKYDYQVLSALDGKHDFLSGDLIRKISVDSYEPSRELQSQLDKIKREATSESHYEKDYNRVLLEKLMTYYAGLNLRYNLSPRQQYATIDEFLFNQGEGYCSHFALTFATLARAVGLQAIIVTGFYGGEYNSYGNYVKIREKDSHAWVEIYSNGRWIHVDPTLLVNPTALSDVQRSQENQPFSMYGFQFQGSHPVVVYIRKGKMYLESLNTRMSLYLESTQEAPLVISMMILLGLIGLVYIRKLIVSIIVRFQENERLKVRRRFYHLRSSLLRKKVIFPWDGPVTISSKLHANMEKQKDLIQKYIKAFY